VLPSLLDRPGDRMVLAVEIVQLKKEKVNQSEAIKTNVEAQSHETIPIRFSRSAASSACLAFARASWISFSLFFIIS
jgi:glucose-6-phosphate dehydrogenase assembly protein OpcA